jgi:copper chaperone CopZ
MKKILCVNGMTCDHCASTIKKSVESLVGILNIEVEIEKNQVTLEIDETTVKIKDVVEKIRAVGFQVRM